MMNEYVTVGTNDFDRSRIYYDAVLPLLGAKMIIEYPGMAFCYHMPSGFRIWVVKPQNGKMAEQGNGQMTGFYATNTEMVDAAHAAALISGGSDEGAPGLRPIYGPEFYGGYARDPDGNKMSFVTYVKTEPA